MPQGHGRRKRPTMADKTKIEWCDATWNPVTGCTPCSPGCDHCYARRMLSRHLPEMGHDEDPGTLVFHEDRLDTPEHWRKPRLVFCGSMTDMFQDGMPPNWQTSVLHTMRSLRGRHHTYILLTKRPGNARKVFVGLRNGSDTLWPLPNVWLGVTICTREELYKREVLRRTPAALRFVSFEPLLGDMGTVNLDGIGWVIVGGETGPGARIMRLDWVHRIQDDCRAAGIPFFFKGWGTAMMRKGQPAYTRVDGLEYHEFPEGRP